MNLRWICTPQCVYVSFSVWRLCVCVCFCKVASGLQRGVLPREFVQTQKSTAKQETRTTSASSFPSVPHTHKQNQAVLMQTHYKLHWKSTYLTTLVSCTLKYSWIVSAPLEKNRKAKCSFQIWTVRFLALIVACLFTAFDACDGQIMCSAVMRKSICTQGIVQNSSSFHPSMCIF